MRALIASNIMRTTVTELLTEALGRRRQRVAADKPRFSWVSKPMNAKVDLADKEALYSLLDQR